MTADILKYIYDIDSALKAFSKLGRELSEQLGLPYIIYKVIERSFIAALLLAFISVLVMFLIWFERRLSARFQARIGPNRVGPQGMLQSIADTVKLLSKENIVPDEADKIVHFLAPIIVFTSAFMAYLCIPFGKNLIASDLNLGILFIFAVTSINVIGILMAGWGSNNKYSMLGGMRSAAQIISYEIPLVLSTLGVVMITGTLRLGGIIDAQKGFIDWFLLKQPFGFIVYIIAATAELNRGPFDIPEAESELTAGYHTEYSGIRFSMFFLAEFTNMFMVSAMATCLFLGGWHGFRFVPSYIWFLSKCIFVIFLLVWFKWTFPRLRVDQLMNLGWKFLIPIALLNIFLTGIGLLVFRG